MHASIKPINKLWHIMFREYIKLPTFTQYQKTQKNQLEVQMNAQNNKRQNLSRK
jgi:hypothetical protein